MDHQIYIPAPMKETVELSIPFVGGGKHASHLKEVVPAAAGSTLPTSEL